MTPACAGLLELRGSGFKLLQSTFNAKNLVRRLFWSISSHFVTIHCWNVRCSQKLRVNLPKFLFWGYKVVKVIDVDKSKIIGHHSPVLAMICSKSVPICNRFHTIGANSGKITFLKGVPLFDALIRGDPLTQRHEILSRKTKVLGAAHSENFVILASPFWHNTAVWQTDGLTDRRPGHS